MAPKKDPKKGNDEPKKIVVAANPAADRELYWAVRERKDIAKINNLVKIKNANPNTQNPITRWTPLHRAVAAGFVELVEVLLKLGANPNWKDEPKLPGEDDVDPKAKAKAKAKAAPKKDAKAATVREERPAPRPLEPVAEGGTALHLAVEGAILQILSLIMGAQGLDPNIPDKKGRTPLMLACGEGKLISVRRLIQHEKVDPMVKDPFGRTAFLLAASRGHDRVCRLLVDKYGSGLVDGSDKENRGAVEYAMGLGTMNPGMMYPRILDFVRSVKPAALDGKDITHLSSMVGGITVLRGLDKNVKPEPLEPGTKLVTAGTHFNSDAIQQKDTALMKACRGVLTSADLERAERQLQVAKHLVAMNDQKIISARNSSTQTVLHVACGALPMPKKKEEHKDEGFKHTHRIGTDRSGMEEMKNMLTRGKEDEPQEQEEKDPVGMTRDGQRMTTEQRGIKKFSTAATEARERLHLEMVQMLVDAGVPKDFKDERQMTAFDYAKWYGDLQCCRVFDASYGAQPVAASVSSRAQTPDMFPSRAQTPDAGGFRPDTPDMLSEMSTRPSTPGIGLTSGGNMTASKKELQGLPEQDEEES